MGTIHKRSLHALHCLTRELLSWLAALLRLGWQWVAESPELCLFSAGPACTWTLTVGPTV